MAVERQFRQDKFFWKMTYYQHDSVPSSDNRFLQAQELLLLKPHFESVSRLSLILPICPPLSVAHLSSRALGASCQ